MAALMWLVASVVLAGAEALAGELFLLMLAGGALTAAGFSAVTDFPVWVDGLVFGASSLLLLVAVRPALKRRFATPPPTQTGTAALPGKQALVLEDVAQHSGRIKLDGDEWTARPLDVTESYPEGSTVTVMEIDGATAVVWRGP